MNCHAAARYRSQSSDIAVVDRSDPLRSTVGRKPHHKVETFHQACEMLNGFLGKPVGFEELDDLGYGCVYLLQQLIRAESVAGLLLFVGHASVSYILWVLPFGDVVSLLLLQWWRGPFLR